MIEAALASLNQITSPPFRATLWKVLAITLALLAAVWFALEYSIVHYIAVPWPWLGTTLSALTGVGLLVGMAFIVAPVSALVASLWLDDLADIVEADLYPPGQRGRPLPAAQALWLGLRFGLVSLAVNFVALLLFLLPGVNAVVFFVANGYLFGREYFELAALRFRPIEEVRVQRARLAPRIFLAGLMIAAFVAIPVVNLATPLFGVALMVRLRRRWSSDPQTAKTAL